MENTIEPRISNWYERLSDHRIFQVVAVDDDDATVELQHFDGDVEEVSLSEWHEMDIEQSIGDLLADVNIAEVTRDIDEMRQIDLALQRLAVQWHICCIADGILTRECCDAYAAFR